MADASCPGVSRQCNRLCASSAWLFTSNASDTLSLEAALVRVGQGQGVVGDGGRCEDGQRGSQRYGNMRTPVFSRGNCDRAACPDRQCRPETPRTGAKGYGVVALLATVLLTPTPREGAWPEFLAPRQAYPTDLIAGVEGVWLEPTFSRSVQGRPAAVPFGLYVALVDAPEITAGAARVLAVARHEVRALGEDWYQADDRDGARGVYRVLARTPHRRVVLSWGEHRGSILGTITGSALTVIELTEWEGAVKPRLVAYVRIDQGLAARLARLLVPVFGAVVDRKLAAGFVITARVAEWAVEQPAEFCDWLRNASFSRERRDRIVTQLAGCAGADPGRRASRSLGETRTSAARLRVLASAPPSP
jgi:hypothetical protein